MIGGVGLRRTRPNRQELREGDIVDLYRVEEIVPDRLLRFHVEMRLPGEGWLQFETRPLDERRSTLTQTVFFAPKGLLGFLYWYMLYPIHCIIFNCTLRKMAQKAQEPDAVSGS
jgi:hypothetical protein